MELWCNPIGLVRSALRKMGETPIQAAFSEEEGAVEVYPNYAAGLKDIVGFSHITLLYWFHQSGGYDLVVRPYLDREEHGIFAVRYPARPNPIDISTVELLGRSENELRV